MIFERTSEEILNTVTKGLFNYYCSLDKFEVNCDKLENDAIYVASRKKPLLLRNQEEKKIALDALVYEYNRFAIQDNLKGYSELKPSGVTIYLKTNDWKPHTGPVYDSVIYKIEKAINSSGKAVMISAVVHCHNQKCSHIHVVWKYIKGKRNRFKVLENIDNAFKKGAQ